MVDYEIIQKGVKKMKHTKTKLPLTGKQKGMYVIAVIVSIALISLVIYGASSAVYAMTQKNNRNMQAMNDRAVELYSDRYDAYLALLAQQEKQRLAEEEAKRLAMLEAEKNRINTELDARKGLEFAGIDPSRIVYDKYGRPIYRIAWGDTLCKLSRAFNYSVQELAGFNQIPNPNLIYAESMLRIPSNLVNDENTPVQDGEE